MITLPTKAIEATVTSPKTMVIYSKPKVGKTSCLVTLPDSLLIDLERGSNSYTGIKIDVISEAEKHKVTVPNYMYNLSQEIKKAGKPYKFLVFDTITSLEDHCKSYALKLYQETPMGAKYTGDILSLPNGGGYHYLRIAFTNVLDWFENAAEHLIFIGHVKDVFLTKNDTEVSVKSLDLTGKLKNIVSSGVDAIGIMYREDSNTNILSFETSEEVECGSRFDHLSNQKIVISEKDEKGNIITHWNKIFLNLK